MKILLKSRMLSAIIITLGLLSAFLAFYQIFHGPRTFSSHFSDGGSPGNLETESDLNGLTAAGSEGLAAGAVLAEASEESEEGEGIIYNPEAELSFPTAETLAIQAVNPGYDGNAGEMIELVNLSGGPLALSGVGLRYINGSGNYQALYLFPEGAEFRGERLVLRYAKAPEVQEYLAAPGESASIADDFYETTLAFSAGLELFYLPDLSAEELTAVLKDKTASEAPISGVCWTGKGECFKAFSSGNPTTLVLSGDSYIHESEYVARFEGALYLPPAEEEPVEPNDPEEPENPDVPGGMDEDGLKPCAEGYERNPETNRCRKITEELAVKECEEGYYLNAATNRCNKIKEESTTAKECAEGYYLNTETNRCNKIKEETVKTCEEGYVLNPETNRCNKVKEEETAKTCEEGYVLNPETNRCNKIKEETSIATSETPVCAGLIFTEILSYFAEDQTEQFIELMNPGAEKIPLAGCFLKYKNKYYALSGEVQAGDYFAYRPTEFKLTKNPSSENEIELIDATGEAVAALTYSHGQKSGTSYAYFDSPIDGNSWALTYQPTPGEPNVYQEYKTCPAGKVINEETGNCVKATTLSATLAECPEGKYRNPATNRCKSYETIESNLAECKEGYERNPETNRCRKVQNNSGADYSLVPLTGEVEEQTSFIALWSLVALAGLGVLYVAFQFRKDLAYGARKIIAKFKR